MTKQIRPKIIPIISGKGGVGKSTIALNIALGLVKKGYNVSLCDCDIDTPNFAQIAGITEKIKLTIDEDEKIIPYRWKNIDVVSLGFSFPEGAPVLWDDSQKREVISQIIHLTKWNDPDYIILDAPAGTGAELSAAFNLEGVVGSIIVTTPHAAAVADARRAKQMLWEYKIPMIGIINNMSYLNVVCPCPCGHNFKLDINKEEMWNEDDIIAEFPIDVEILNTNIINDFEHVIDEILFRIPKLEPIVIKKAKLSNFQRRALKYAIRKISPS